jgi:hypothetical protein
MPSSGRSKEDCARHQWCNCTSWGVGILRLPRHEPARWHGSVQFAFGPSAATMGHVRTSNARHMVAGRILKSI